MAVAGLFALIALPAFAADVLPESVYGGTLGKREVVLESGLFKTRPEISTTADTSTSATG